MATNDLSNKELIVQNYIKEVFKSEFPDLDVSDHGAFMEMFGLPHIKLLTPLMEFADRVKLTQSLDNASLMTEAEMDEYAAGRFFYRKNGDYSIGYITLSFDDIPSNGTIQIAAGTQAESKQGYRYRAVDTVIYDENDLANYYDSESFLYNITVLFESENPGSQYDINENEISSIIQPLPHLVSAVNLTSFTGGKDKETNQELADRIKTTAMTPNVGVERGWYLFAKQFSDVQDVIVAGFGHPLMQRDIIGTLNAGTFNQNVSPDVHWGGKIDLHIRGAKLTDYVDTKQIAKNTDGDLVVYLDMHPVRDISEIRFSSARYTDPEYDDSFFVVKDFVLLKDENPETMGTLNETAWVVIKDERLNESDIAIVSYRYNQLLSDMSDSLYQQDNRPPASDVLLKESKEKIIHGAMIIRLESVTGIQEKNKSIIRQRLYNWIKDLPTGVELQFSDMTEPIYQYEDDSIDTKVDYISLPSQFLVTDYDNKNLYYCLNQEKRDFLDEVQSASVYFSQWIPYYMDNITVYDFFDVMHVLNYQNVEIDAWTNLSLIDHDWGKRVNYINTAKRMLAYVNSIYRLSPSKWTAQPNDYFNLGYLAVYEDVKYATSDIQNLVNLFETIANPGSVETEYSIDNLLHLTIYCSVLLYVLTADNIGGMTVKSLFDWLIDLTKGTPIDYEVHH